MEVDEKKVEEAGAQNVDINALNIESKPVDNNSETKSEPAKVVETSPQKKKKFAVIAVIAILIIAAVIVVICLSSNDAEEEEQVKVITVSEASLRKVIELSELSTIQYTYNAIARVKDASGNVMYHVAYEGIVNAGIDFSEININIDEENKIIKIVLPNVEIVDCTVDAGTLDYIFIDDKYDTSEVPTQAYSICLNDLKQRAEEEDDLLILGKENAISTVKGLIEPWVEQIENYTIEVG